MNVHTHSRKRMVWAEKMSLQGGGRCISIAEFQIKVSAFGKKKDHLPKCCNELRDSSIKPTEERGVLPQESCRLRLE